MDALDDDDALAQPSSLPATNQDGEHDDGGSSGDEDGGLDWAALPTGPPDADADAAARPAIPRRGEKDFEPAPAGSGLQAHQLARARAAMFGVLRAVRSTSIKSTSFAVWYPELARAHVVTARGAHFAALGHSVAREDSGGKKRLELLPEEALYLLEKGALVCWRALAAHPITGEEADGALLGAPMSVQEALADMLGRAELSLERYQVYASLRRLGYVVTRARPPSAAYPAAAPYPSPPPPPPPPPITSFLQRMLALLVSPFRRLGALCAPALDWWAPLAHYRLTSYGEIFRALRLIPAGHGVPLRHAKPQAPLEEGPYAPFWNLYKPPTPFRKTAPPAPDFVVAVVNARTTPMPTLAQLDALFATLPDVPPPQPRIRRAPPPPKPAAPPPTPLHALWARLFGAPARAPYVNPFPALRQGSRVVVVAAVDGGVPSFFRFGRGGFEEWPMV